MSAVMMQTCLKSYNLQAKLDEGVAKPTYNNARLNKILDSTTDTIAQLVSPCVLVVKDTG